MKSFIWINTAIGVPIISDSLASLQNMQFKLSKK